MYKDCIDKLQLLVVKQTRVLDGNRSLNPHTDRPAHLELSYRETPVNKKYLKFLNISN